MFERFYFLNLIEYYTEKFNIEFDSENRYYSSLSGLKKFLQENEVILSENERENIINYLYYLEIPLMNQNIFKILNSEIELNEENICEIEEYKPEFLDDTKLLGYLVSVLSVITYNQKGNLLLMKYNVAIWNTGFHLVAKECRGKIIDLDTKKIVSYPFDKFFNLNEVPETNETLVKSWINESDYVWATDKIDGSTIIVSKYKNKPLITTNGSFENDQTKWAKELFDEKYPEFLKNIKDGYTYIFELVHPENKIVLDYNGEKSLYLLNIRDMNTEKLISLNDVHNVAKQYGFPVPEVYNFKDLDTMVHLAHTLSGVNKEGWVIRIGVGDCEYMVKLKLDEYFAMHKAFGKIRLGWVYKHLIMGDLDDFLAICNDEQKSAVFEKLDIVNTVREKIKNKAILEANCFLKKYNITANDFHKDRDRMITITKDILSSKSNVKHFALQFLKSPVKLETSVNSIYYKHMRGFFEEFGYNVME